MSYQDDHRTTAAEPETISVSSVDSMRVVLLRMPTVIQWAYGDLSFLQQPPETMTSKMARTAFLKKEEDAWGQSVMKQVRPDLHLNQQWTNVFGEILTMEAYTLLGETAFKPKRKNKLLPDCETENRVIESKTQTYYTRGTAGEKILGAPFKYASVPDVYGKPLDIVCIGGAERVCKTQYGNLAGPVQDAKKQEYLQFLSENRIRFVAFTDLLERIHCAEYV